MDDLNKLRARLHPLLCVCFPTISNNVARSGCPLLLTTGDVVIHHGWRHTYGLDFNQDSGLTTVTFFFSVNFHYHFLVTEISKRKNYVFFSREGGTWAKTLVGRNATEQSREHRRFIYKYGCPVFPLSHLQKFCLKKDLRKITPAHLLPADRRIGPLCPVPRPPAPPPKNECFLGTGKRFLARDSISWHKPKKPALVRWPKAPAASRRSPQRRAPWRHSAERRGTTVGAPCASTSGSLFGVGWCAVAAPSALS